MGAVAVGQVPQYYLAYRLDGESSGDCFGWSASRVADVTGDGQSDLVIGAPGWGGGSCSSHVYLIGQTMAGGTTLARIDDGGGNNKLGYSVCGLSDVTGDGVPDYAAGAMFGEYVLWCNGADRTIGGDYASHPALIHQETGGGDTHYFGRAVEALGTNGDLLEATRPACGGLGTFVEWFSKDASGITRRMTIQAYCQGNDPAVRNVGDVVGNDDIDDFLFSSSENPFDHRGRVHLISGATTVSGTVYVEDIEEFHFDGPRTNTDIGALQSLGQNPLAAAGDFTGDGVVDFAIGGPCPVATGEYETSGTVYFYDGSNGNLLWELPKPQAIEGYFGAMVENIGDVDGDGHDDIAIGSRSENFSGKVIFYSPYLQEIVGEIEGDSAGDGFGRTITALGDINTDGIPDFGIGAPYADFGAEGSGSYYVYLSVPEPATLSLLTVGALALIRRRRK
ncbi:MAG: FG-GAP repeat protein [Phycisphaerae bacterium]|nr:FG-GAP repeat protein [Phycisphaerae bacterium]